ncbi:AbrB family transcriptional regulator [Paradevosia shaoguanensis]|uniref:AbrB family transcriptional regulator n=1 Tax=Paradevosia shaoguanensis TaxID=1335043 RepID=UPI00193395D8|nr:AbrB family transcriptional regulator [Paradevosia shaoguanensis]
MSGPKPSQATMLGHTLMTLVIAAAGGFVGQMAQIPAGWLMGSALAAAGAALAGVKVTVPGWLRDITFVLTGMSMGANVARDSLSLIAQWPISLLGLALELVLIIATTGYMLRKLFRLDNATAYLSSFPGHLSFVMGIAATGLGDPRQITIIQVIRIMMLTLCVPMGALFLPIEHFSAPANIVVMDAQTLVMLAIACAITGFLFTRLRVPAGMVLGAMAAATAAKLGGLFDGAMPVPLANLTFVLVGALIGSRFAGITLTEFRQAAIGGLIATAMTVGIVTAIAYGVSLLVDMPFGQIWLGLSPGALEGMGALGVALGYDTAFIAAHHVSRLLMLTVAIPLVAMMVAPRKSQPV